MVDFNAIKLRFQLLANADPQIYEQLIKLCEQYVWELMETVTQAPADSVLISQGHAQQARKFLQLMTEKPTA